MYMMVFVWVVWVIWFDSVEFVGGRDFSKLHPAVLRWLPWVST